MSATVRTPRSRVCEQCGRAEEWDDAKESWQIAREGGERLAGDPHCIHEWDINGTFNPLNGE